MKNNLNKLVIKKDKRYTEYEYLYGKYLATWISSQSQL